MVHDESCPCAKGDEGDAIVVVDATPESASEPVVISLCHVRERHGAASRAERLLQSLCDIHSLGIRIHNDVIERCHISVLSELCRGAGIYFDLVPEELRTSVLTPSSLYGRSLGRIYGKEPLQKRIGRCIQDEGQRELWGQLERSPLQLWCYHKRSDATYDEAHLLTGPGREEVHCFAGIIARSGEIQRQSGHYLGWVVEFEGVKYLVFGFSMSPASVKRFLGEALHTASVNSRDYWERLELAMIRAAVDPLDRHHRSGAAGGGHPSWWSGSYRPGRRWLLRKILARLTEEFSQHRCKLSLRAHIATVLVDDIRGVADYLAAVDQIREDVMLQFGGGRPGEAEIGLDDVLKVFHLSQEGGLETVSGLDEHPVAVLLLDPVHLDSLDVDRLTPIREVLYRVRQFSQSMAAQAVEAAWTTYQVEYYWLGTHGLSLGQEEAIEAGASEHEDTPVLLPDMRALFDRRFFDTPLEELSMIPRDRIRFIKAFSSSRWFKEPGTLRSLPEDEHDVRSLEGVGEKTIHRLRAGLLETGLYWRWARAGLDYRAFRPPRAGAGGGRGALAQIHSGLDELADLFD